MSDRPRVSVVMAVYNRADYLPQALASIRWQTFTDWECVCVDDGSTDDTPRVLAGFAAADPRFRVLRQENSGVAIALTRGDAAARGEWIARMDSDDVAVPTRLEKQLAFVDANPDCVGLGGAVLLTDPTGAPLGRSSYATEHETIEREMLSGRGQTIAHPTLFFRRAVIDRVGSYRAEYEAAHDPDFIVRLATAGRLANLSEVLLLYRQHPGNFCRTRQVEIARQMIDVVREAHEARGLDFDPEVARSMAVIRKPTPVLGKWARQAARHGYPRTAIRLARQLVATDPVSVYTARVVAEVALRIAIATARGRRGESIDLPDWRAWDCPRAAPSSCAA